MPHFKSPDGALHFLSDEDIEKGGRSYLPAGCIEISDEVAAALSEAAYRQPSATDVLRAQIVALEAEQTPRRIREAVLGIDGGWLADVNQQIADLRAQL